MVLITKDEKEKILKEFPHVCIVRTVKQKSNRHRYYCEEQRGAMRLLAKIRGIDIGNNPCKNKNTKRRT